MSEQERADGERPVYSKINIHVSSDKMVATVGFDHTDSNAYPTAEMIKKALQDKGVVFGFDEAAIEQGAKDGKDFEAALGKEPQHGEDAYLKKNYDLGVKGRPKTDEYDRADYKNMNLFVLVKQGELLAERVLQTDGEPGMNVLGGKVNQKKGRPLVFKAGKNSSIRDENFLYADIDGQIVDTGKVIGVDPRLVIKEDVGVGTGNIEFTGAVAVQGSVQAGFVVKATGDIEVGGIVSGAEVEGNNILIKGGIQGMNRGFVKAKGTLTAFFAENAEIEAGHNVTIADVVLNSQVRAGKKVTVLGRRGQIMGGSTFAGEEIEATQIGNPANVATKLEVGVNPMVQRQYKAVCQEYGDTKKKLDEIKKTLATLGKVDISKLPPERQEMVAQLGKVRFQVEGQLERLLEEMDELEEKIQSMKRGRIRAADTIYPGVKLKINNVIKNVHSEEKRCTLSVEGDQIRTGAY